MKRVLLLNQGKTENLGDKAINIVFKEILKENGCIVDSVGFGQTNELSMTKMNLNKKYTLRSFFKKLVPYFFIWFFKYRKKIEYELINTTRGKQYDLVIIGGGQLIKSKSVFVYILLTWYNVIKKHLNCPINIAGVGADPKYSLIEKNIYKRLLPKFDSIYVRDEKSQEILKEQFQINAGYIPDLVFAFTNYFKSNATSNKNKLLVMIYDYNALKNHFGTNYNKEEYYRQWEKLITENMDSNLEITLGYTTIGDKSETLNFSDYLKKNTDFKFSISYTDDIDSFINVLKTTKKLISGRMHGMLLGMNFECDVIPYVVSPKVDTFKKEWINRHFDKKEISREIDSKIKEILK